MLVADEQRMERVMPGLVPGIHVLKLGRQKDVDGRDKPGHDEGIDKLTTGMNRCGNACDY
jgi:hypothetical protein